MIDFNDFAPAKRRTKLTSGEMIRFCREFKGWTQKKLSEKTGIAISNISGLENNRLILGKNRAIKFSEAFEIHPGTLMFPNYEISGKQWAA